MQFAITIDTEVDKSPDWSVSSDASFEGVTRGVQGILHPLFVEKAITPVYFLSNEILADRSLSSIFEKFQIEKSAEVGTHLHYEAAGPLEVGEIAGRKLDGVQAQLAESDERVALQWLTDKYEERFSKKPVSFRAGRYGLSRHSIALLAELGYKVDSSATPGLVWDYKVGDRNFVTDYRDASTQPYECNPNDPSMVGASGVLQMPISLEKAPLSPRETLRLALGKQRRWIWARPMFASKPELLRMIEASAKRQNQADIIVMMFHNMEIIPGKSPYCATEHDAASYLDCLVYFIEQATNYGLSSITLEDYARKFHSRLFKNS